MPVPSQSRRRGTQAPRPADKEGGALRDSCKEREGAGPVGPALLRPWPGIRSPRTRTRCRVDQPREGDEMTLHRGFGWLATVVLALSARGAAAADIVEVQG